MFSEPFITVIGRIPITNTLQESLSDIELHMQMLNTHNTPREVDASIREIEYLIHKALYSDDGLPIHMLEIYVRAIEIVCQRLSSLDIDMTGVVRYSEPLHRCNMQSTEDLQQMSLFECVKHIMYIQCADIFCIMRCGMYYISEAVLDYLATTVLPVVRLKMGEVV